MEVWKQVSGFEGYYEVSNLGRVRSFPRKYTRNEVKIIKGGVNTQGYKAVFLSRKSKVIPKRVHLLVAEAFIGERGNKYVNHKDGNKLNNEVANLEYVTASENMRHSWENGLRSAQKVKGYFFKDRKTGRVLSTREASEESGYSAMHFTCMVAYGKFKNKTNFDLV